MRRALHIALSVVLLPLLPGCAALGIRPSPTLASSDMPQADALDRSHEKALYLAVVEGLHRQDQCRAALAYLDDFERKYPGDQYATLLRAQCLSATGREAEAKPIYLSLSSGPYAAAANAGLGNIAGGQGDWISAGAHFQEAVRFEPAKAEYVNDLGFARVREGAYDSGIEQLGRAAQLDPDNRFIRNNLILGLHLAGRDREAAALIDRIADPADRKQAISLLLVPTKLPAASAMSGADANTLPLPRDAINKEDVP
jgi:Flp pilus assembly protein TadD